MKNLVFLADGLPAAYLGEGTIKCTIMQKNEAKKWFKENQVSFVELESSDVRKLSEAMEVNIPHVEFKDSLRMRQGDIYISIREKNTSKPQFYILMFEKAFAE